MSAVTTGASSFETARSAPPQDEEEMPRMWRLALTLRRAERPVSKGEARAPQHGEGVYLLDPWAINGHSVAGWRLPAESRGEKGGLDAQSLMPAWRGRPAGRLPLRAARKRQPGRGARRSARRDAAGDRSTRRSRCGRTARRSPCAPAAPRPIAAAPAAISAPAPAAFAAGAMSASGGPISGCCRAAPASSRSARASHST